MSDEQMKQAGNKNLILILTSSVVEGIGVVSPAANWGANIRNIWIV